MNKYLKYPLIAAAILLTAGCASREKDELAHDHNHGAETGEHVHPEGVPHSHEDDSTDDPHAGHNHADEAHDHEAEGHEGHDHGAATAEGESASEIVLEPSIAAKFGVKVEKIEPGDFSSTISVSGQIVDAPNSSSVVSAPTSGIIRFAGNVAPGKEIGAGSIVASISSQGVTGGDANAVSKAALDAAKKELDRVTPLYKEGIVTVKTYNDAVQAYQQAKASYSSSAASGNAKAVSAGVITQLLVQNGQYVAAGDPIATISSNKELTLRADLPEKYYRELPTLVSANLIMPYTDQVVKLSDLKGRRVASSQAVTSQRGYIPVYFTFVNDGSVIPGTLVKAMLIGNAKRNVLSVPVGALSEQQGQYFVYEQVDPECYEKIPVKIGASNGEKVEILSGLHGGEDIVTEGIMAVRLAETSSVVPEGHSHSH